MSYSVLMNYEKNSSMLNTFLYFRDKSNIYGYSTGRPGQYTTDRPGQHLPHVRI